MIFYNQRACKTLQNSKKAGHCLTNVFMFLLKFVFVLCFSLVLFDFLLLFHSWMQWNLFSGNHTWTCSGEYLPEIQFRCISGAFTPEFHLSFPLPQFGSGKFTCTFLMWGSVTFMTSANSFSLTITKQIYVSMTTRSHIGSWLRSVITYLYITGGITSENADQRLNLSTHQTLSIVIIYAFTRVIDHTTFLDFVLGHICFLVTVLGHICFVWFLGSHTRIIQKIKSTLKRLQSLCSRLLIRKKNNNQRCKKIFFLCNHTRSYMICMIS